MKPESGAASKSLLCAESLGFVMSLFSQKRPLRAAHLNCDWWWGESCRPTWQEENYTVIKLGPRWRCLLQMSEPNTHHQTECTGFKKNGQRCTPRPGCVLQSWNVNTLQNTSLVQMSEDDGLWNLVGQQLWPTLAANFKHKCWNNWT